jgi:CheY-like chemotaxis protein/two-component sensor histidine kinase
MIYAGKEDDILELIDVSKAVEGMLGLLKVSVSSHATLVTDLGENLPAVNARAAQLRQIVMNLVVNAREAMKGPEGVITVATKSVTVGYDSAGETWAGLSEGEYVQLEISDDGKGMSPEIQAKVFDPFFTTKSAGHGLGLAVVDGIVRSLSGAIRLVSELEKGTTFQILLPCAGAADAASMSADGEDEVAPTSPNATILVVEDEYPLRVALTKMLGKAGFGILEVDNGTDAIELLRAKANKIDVILLDVTIPGAPTYEVLANAVQFRPKMKIILTSAYSEQIAKVHVNRPQVCGFIRKPFKFGILIETLRQVLSSQEAL